MLGPLRLQQIRSRQFLAASHASIQAFSFVFVWRVRFSYSPLVYEGRDVISACLRKLQRAHVVAGPAQSCHGITAQESVRPRDRDQHRPFLFSLSPVTWRSFAWR